MNEQLQHHGILGQKWGVRRRPPYPLNGDNYSLSKKKVLDRGTQNVSYIKETIQSKKMFNTKNGSTIFPKGFVFNRVGKTKLDVNASGALYVSYGKSDAARYIKNLGPTFFNKLFGTYGEAVQHISVKENLTMSSPKTTAIETAKVLLNNKNLLNSFNESFYSLIVTDDFNKKITEQDINEALKKPMEKEGQKLAYAVNSMLGNPTYAKEAKMIYDHFRKQGFDVIPDLQDRLSGTSESAAIIINPNKVKITSTFIITKDVMRESKQYVKSLNKLKVSELIK